MISCYCFQIEWRCAGSRDVLQVFVDDVEAPVRVGNGHHTHTHTVGR